MGGGERRSVASDTISAAHLFPLLPRARRTSFHETRSVERNLLLASERCVGNAQRRAEPPTNTSVSARMQTPLPHSGLQRKKTLLLHRRTITYEPRPNISPRPPRPRTPSAGRRRLHAPAHLRRARVFVHLHRYRALQTYGLRGRVFCARFSCNEYIYDRFVEKALRQ